MFTFCHRFQRKEVTDHKCYGESETLHQRAILVALGLVYYFRLNKEFRETYKDRMKDICGDNKFTDALDDEVHRTLCIYCSFQHNYSCTWSLFSIQRLDEFLLWHNEAASWYSKDESPERKPVLHHCLLLYQNTTDYCRRAWFQQDAFVQPSSSSFQRHWVKNVGTDF